jgi:hypothetical protein
MDLELRATMEYLWIIAAPLFLLSVWISFSNLWIILRFYLFGKRGSTVPLIGGLFGVFGICFAPSDTLKNYWWVPLALDPGSLPLLIHTLVFVITGKYKKHGSKKEDK